MNSEIDIISLKARVRELEDRIQFLYTHLNITYAENPEIGNAKVIEMLRKGNKIEAIKVYREIYNVGLAEAKRAVERVEAGLGL